VTGPRGGDHGGPLLGSEEDSGGADTLGGSSGCEQAGRYAGARWLQWSSWRDQRGLDEGYGEWRSNGGGRNRGKENQAADGVRYI
jgi:hypothetical protein